MILSPADFRSLRAYLIVQGFDLDLVDGVLGPLEGLERNWESEYVLARVPRLVRKLAKPIDPAKRLSNADAVRLFSLRGAVKFGP